MSSNDLGLPGLVDVMVAPAREKLAQLKTAQQRRKQATILFIDIAGHTSLTRHLDPEENMEVVDEAVVRLAVPIRAFVTHTPISELTKRIEQSPLNAYE